jgi:hypothetical protein
MCIRTKFIHIIIILYLLINKKSFFLFLKNTFIVQTRIKFCILFTTVRLFYSGDERVNVPCDKKQQIIVGFIYSVLVFFKNFSRY